MRRKLILLLTVGALIAGSESHAGDVLANGQGLDPFKSSGMSSMDVSSPETNAFGDVGVVDAAQMGELRGREGGTSITVATDQDLNASVVGGAITADTFATGGVSFGDNAFDNFGGVGLVNVVTGNNNAVEAAIGVTFNLLD